MKMKKIKYGIIGTVLVLGGMMTSCDTLDIDNLNSYDESMVWNDVNLATAYVNNLYTECFGNWNAGADNNSEQVTGIPWYLGTITETGGAYKSWDYTAIRHINEAIKRLEAIYDVLKAYNVADYVSFDLSMCGTYGYYTGIIFRGYTFGTGDAIVKGGRYDKLLEKFGKESPSIGFAIVIDELMNAMIRQKLRIMYTRKNTIILYDAYIRKIVNAILSVFSGNFFKSFAPKNPPIEPPIAHKIDVSQFI